MHVDTNPHTHKQRHICGQLGTQEEQILVWPVQVDPWTRLGSLGLCSLLTGCVSKHTFLAIQTTDRLSPCKRPSYSCHYLNNSHPLALKIGFDQRRFQCDPRLLITLYGSHTLSWGLIPLQTEGKKKLFPPHLPHLSPPPCVPNRRWSHTNTDTGQYPQWAGLWKGYWV